MERPSSGSSFPSSPEKMGLGNSINFPLPIDDDIEERMASISYLTSSFEVEDVVVKTERDELPDLGSRAGVTGIGIAVVDLAIPPLVQNSPKQGLGSPGIALVGIRKDGVPEMEGRVASPVPMEEDNAERRDEDVALKHADHLQSTSPRPVPEGEFTIDLLGQWAQEDFNRANERGRLISSWYTQVESTREENYYLYERVDQLSEELQAQSSRCLAAEKSLEDSRLMEVTLRAVVERRDSRIDELTRELEDVKSQLARATRIAMGPEKQIPAAVASSSEAVTVREEPLFGAELSTRLLFYYRFKMNKALDYLSESHGFDLGVFERGGYSDQELEAFMDKIPDAGAAPSYLLKP